MVSFQKRGHVWQYQISYKDLDGTYKKVRKSGFLKKSDAELAASQIQAAYVDPGHYQQSSVTLVTYFN